MFEDDLVPPQALSLKTWSKVFPVLKTVRKKIVINIIICLFVAIIDVSLPLLLGYCINQFIVPKQTQGMVPVLILGTMLILAQGILVKYMSSNGISLEVTITKKLRDMVFFHLQELSFSYYNQTPVGYMMARTSSDTERIGELVTWGLVDCVTSGAYCIGAIIAMFSLNPKIALVVTVTIIPISLLTVFFQKKILVQNRLVRKVNSQVTGAINEGITGARTTKVLVNEIPMMNDFSSLTGKYKKEATHFAFLRAVYLPVLMFIGTASTSLVLGLGGYEVIHLGIGLSVLTIFIQYAGGFFDPVQQIANTVTNVVATQVNIERIFSLMEKTPDVVDRPDVIEKYGDTFHPKVENWEPVQGAITFQDVTFRYPDGNENVLEHFSLTIPAGTYVAIVGETGAGKSTLVNLACRFFEPTEGIILVDGTDYRERSQLWLHSALGYVLQNPHLFSGSVRENIRYGRLEATDEEVEEAARTVSADTFIQNMENGYDTDVGEGGDRLSTGEKQLISFARAVLANPRIFVLDEATSSIDTDTELLIQKAISQLLNGRTSFVIAHRLSTIRHADIILVVSDGKIVEQGTHPQLIHAKGEYYRLFTRQFEEDAEQQVLSSL